jgi:saccharopine dehydrogenase-like NADP-dependent oxidoreductase
MNNILIIGAGRSSTALIAYILDKAKENGWYITVADQDPQLAEQRIGNHPNGRAAWLDVQKVNDRRDLIKRTDLVISLVPAHLHLELAQDCIKLNKHLVTASYVSSQMHQMDELARDRSLIFMNELGLDPGIDHMSAKQKIDEIQEKGGVLSAFRSFTGGLVAPESDNNPWHYKISWNPGNVVKAGQGTAQYLENGKLKYIPYHRLFKQSRRVKIPSIGEFEAYANRDSLLYREIYGLNNIPNILRGTLRYPGFCEAWHALVKIGLTDDSYPITDSSNITYHELLEAYVHSSYHPGTSVKDKIAGLLEVSPNSDVIKKMDWLGLFSKKKIKLHQASPAKILESLLIDKWKLEKGDKDMVVMHHEFEYKLGAKNYLLTETLSMKGEDEINTAMSKLVGLPLGIFVNLVMKGLIKSRGVTIPVQKEVYEPILKELEKFGVVFKEELVELPH